MKNKITIPNNKAFVLLELLVTISIFIMILFGITLFAKNIWNYNSFISFGFDNVNAGQQAMRIMPAEIRTASSSNTGAYAINQASATSFTFYSDVYDNGLKEQVRYFLNGTTLQRGEIIPTGSPLSYNGASEKITNLVSNVTNSNIFSYYDTNYDGTTAALATPIDIVSVRLVKINIVVDKDTLHPPAAVTFTTQISLRNLKDNL